MKHHVALIIETSSVYGRDLLSGIVRFMRMHEEWSVFLEQRDLARRPPSWLASWKGDGIISRATTAKLVEAVAATQVPMVELTDRKGASPHIRSDDAAIGQLGAVHLRERGFQRFGFCGFSGEEWSQRREEAFVNRVVDEGWPCEVYQSAWHGSSVRPWEEERIRLADWLRQFKRPFGVMACNDLRGQQVLDACAEVGLAVPEEVAVIGVDNDQLLCRICSPPLSSVMPNAVNVGFRAAELLSRMMNGESVSGPTKLIEPLGVATRQSTDVVAIDDAEIAAALTFIRENACRGIAVTDVTKNVAISRSSLERKVRKYLGRTPQEEIRYVQIRKVCELLSTTDLAVDRIGLLCGFQHSEYMHVVFKRLIHTTPGEYRRQNRQ